MSVSVSGAAAEKNPWRSHTARICTITPETPGVRTYELELEDPVERDHYRFAAGQFNMLYLPGIGEAAISVSSDPAGRDTLAHTVRAVGNVTDALARLGPGDQVFVRGPFGTPWPVAEMLGRDVVIVAGGLREELQRAFLLRRFERHLGGAPAGVVLLSLAFGAGHYVQGWDAVVATSLIGAFWAVVYLRRRSVVAPVVSHAGFDAFEIVRAALS